MAGTVPRRLFLIGVITCTKTARWIFSIETNEERVVFITNWIGAAVIDMNAQDMDITREDITGIHEGKRKIVGNTLYKVVLRDAAALVREK